MKAHLLILLSISGTAVTHAQTDTTMNEHSCLHKTAKVAGIAVPSLMLAYGVSSFYMDGIRQAFVYPTYMDGRLGMGFSCVF